MSSGSRHSGKVEAGRFCPDDPVRWAAALGKLAGRRVLLDVNRETRSHSSNQRRYYFGVVLATVAEWSGHEKEELHDYFKRQFLPVPTRVLPTGEVIEGVPSTKELSLEDYSDYVSKVMAWAANNGLYIPSPNEVV